MFSSVLLFLNIGGGEMILIVFVALLLFGGEKLPEIARGLGKGIRDFKDASDGVKREIANQINSYEEKSPSPVTTVAEEPQLALPEAEAQHQLTEHTEGVSGEAEVHPSVENTMTYVENHSTPVHEEAEHARETKIEPIKTAHE